MARRLGHISKERIQRLMSSGAIGLLNYSDLGVCADCIKGKQTNIRKFGARQSSRVLNLVCTMWPIPCSFLNWPQILNPFTNDYSYYWYLYLIHEKSQLPDMFKIYNAEVENQLNRKIKIIRANYGGEYYDRYDESGRCLGRFANFLKEYGIVA